MQASHQTFIANQLEFGKCLNKYMKCLTKQILALFPSTREV